MIYSSAKWVGKNKKAKLFFTLLGAISVTIGSFLIGSITGALLLVGGILMEVFNVYSISVVTEEARREIESNRNEINQTLDEIRSLDKDIENNRSEITQMLREMRDLSDDIDDSRYELRNIKSEISDYQRELERTEADIESASQDAVDAKKEVQELERSIRRSLGKYYRNR